MSTAAQEFLNPGFLTPIGYPDLTGESPTASPEFNAGGWAFMNDAFGARILTYKKVTQSGGQTVGQLGMRDSDVTITDITAGSTTSFTTTGLTADANVGNFAVVSDAGNAAPENEVGIVVANTATVVNIDPGRPYSAALAANDDLVLVRAHDVIDSTDSTTAVSLQGICFHGVPTQFRWGWYQIYGYYPGAAIGATTSAGDLAAEDTATLGDAGVTGIEDVAARLPVATAAGSNEFALVFVNLVGPIFGGTSDP